MSKTVSISPIGRTSQTTECNVDKNISTARKWYKTKKWHENVKVKVGSCGSSHGGSIKKGLLWISFQNNHYHWPSRAIAVQTSSPEHVFMASLNDAYEEISDHAYKMEKAKHDGKLITCDEYEQSIINKFNKSTGKKSGIYFIH